MKDSGSDRRLRTAGAYTATGVLPLLTAGGVAGFTSPLWWPAALTGFASAFAIGGWAWWRASRHRLPVTVEESAVGWDGEGEAVERYTAGGEPQAVLRRQLEALQALAELDRLLVEHAELEDVLRLILDRVPRVIGCEFAAVLVPRSDHPDEACVYYQRYVDGQNSTMITETLPWFAEEWQALADRREGREVHCDQLPPPYLASLPLPAPRLFHILPLLPDGSFDGLFVVAFAEDRPLGGEESARGRELADRVGLALKSSRRARNLHQKAHYDRLTGLPNRGLLRDLVQWELRFARREQLLVAFLFLDLDGFKRVNDRLGHEAGDRLLTQVSERLQSVVRESDVVARLGGDEFAIVLSRLSRPRDAALVAAAVIERLTETFDVGGKAVQIGTSIGISLFPDDGESEEELLTRADAAMYRAKRQGRGRYLFFTPDMNDEVRERERLRRDLDRAVAGEGLVVHFQPRLDLETKTAVAMEAAVRWYLPGRGWVPAVEFISVAEETGLMQALDDWVLRNSLEQLRDWRRRGVQLEYVCVRMGLHPLSQPGFGEQLLGQIYSQGLIPAELQLSLAEQVLMDEDPVVRDNLLKAAEAGVALSVNGFGGGAACLDYLRRLPVQAVKIDRSLIAELGRDDVVEALAEGVVALVHALDVTVVADGVETPEQESWLRGVGCDLVQGFRYSEPLPANDAERLLRSRRHAMR